MSKTGTSFTAPRLPLTGWALLAVTAVLAAFSMRWGIVHDAALMFYIGREVAAGARSVLDIFDMNMPLVHWLHAAIYMLIGLNEPAWRVCDGLVIAGIGWLGYRLIAPIASPFAPLAALMIVARHVSSGPQMPGQRDVLMLLLVLASATFLIRWAERGRHHVDALSTGFLLGLAANIKPVAVLYAPLLLLAVIAAKGLLKDWRIALLLAFDVAVGAAIPCLIVAGILNAQGALPAFVEIWLAYLLPVYGKLPVSTSALIDPIMVTSLVLGAITLVATMTGAPRLELAQPAVLRMSLLIAVTSGGLLGYLMQGKGWLYQAAPFNYSAILLCAPLLLAIDHSSAQGRRAANILVPTIVMMLVARVGLILYFEAVRSVEGPRSPPPHVQSMIDDLARLGEQTLPVQAFDTTDGAVAAILRSKRHQPTRFIYDFQFFIGSPTPYRAALRNEFLDRLASAGPHLLLVTNQQWPGNQGFERIDDAKLWPELHERVKTGYRLVVEHNRGPTDGQNYRIYRTAP